MTGPQSRPVTDLFVGKVFVEFQADQFPAAFVQALEAQPHQSQSLTAGDFLIRQGLGMPTGLTAFTGAVLLAYMALPTIISVAEDALDAVPKSFRDASLAMGATHWQTIWRVVVPAGRSGILIAVMLGLGRAIGETMAVMMVTGNAARMPTTPDSVFRPARTMTATIAAEMGEVAQGSAHYHVLFGIGIILFLITFVINLAATSAIFKKRRRGGLR